MGFGLFDFDGDGELSALERAAEIGLFEEMMSDDDEDIFEAAGLDRDELEWMDEDERREALEEAGLDLDVYDEW